MSVSVFILMLKGQRRKNGGSKIGTTLTKKQESKFAKFSDLNITSNASSLAGLSVQCSTEVVNCPGDYNITMHCMHDKVIVDCGDGKWVNSIF